MRSGATNAAPPILQVVEVSRSFGGLKAVDGVTLALERGTVTSLIGPNGAGKTTLFNLISGLIPPSRGEVRFEGQRIDGLKPHEIARKGIGRTFQDPRIFYEMTVLDHVMSGFALRGEKLLPALLLGPGTRREIRRATERARALLDDIGMADRAGEKAQDLSFGEQRYLSLARTLAGDPSMVLLDEPTVGLDGGGIRRLCEIIRDMTDRQGKTVLIVEHNLDVIFGISDHIHLLVGGRLVLSGTPDTVRRHPRMIEAYLGSDDVLVRA